MAGIDDPNVTRKDKDVMTEMINSPHLDELIEDAYQQSHSPVLIVNGSGDPVTVGYPTADSMHVFRDDPLWQDAWEHQRAHPGTAIVQYKVGKLACVIVRRFKQQLTPQLQSLFEKVEQDINGLDWSEQAVEGSTEDWEHDGPKLRGLCTQAVVNALAHENRGGFEIPNVAELDLADGHTTMIRMPLVPSGTKPIQVLAQELFKLMKDHKAIRVSYPFVDHTDRDNERIGVVQIKPSGHHYLLIGRIEHLKFVRERLNGDHRPDRPPSAGCGTPMTMAEALGENLVIELFGRDLERACREELASLPYRPVAMIRLNLTDGSWKRRLARIDDPQIVSWVQEDPGLAAKYADLEKCVREHPDSLCWFLIATDGNQSVVRVGWYDPYKENP
jgi:hypothetical protein